MGSVGATALSGLYASEQRIAVAAENIANSDSSNFKAKDLLQTANAAGGVSTQVVDRNPPSISLADGQGGVEQKPNVDPAAELVQANVATYSAQASLKVLKTADKLNQYLLDITA